MFLLIEIMGQFDLEGEEMYIAISIIIISVILFLMFLWTVSLSKNENKKNGNDIISKFEPDNIAPTLTEMIDFHKKNGVVDYDLQRMKI